MGQSGEREKEREKEKREEEEKREKGVGGEWEGVIPRTRSWLCLVVFRSRTDAASPLASSRETRHKLEQQVPRESGPT